MSVGATLKRWYRRVVDAVVRWTRWAVGRWRSSLQVQIVATTLIAGIIAILILGAYISSTIRNGLFEERLDQALSEASNATRNVQTTLNAASVSTGTEVLGVTSSNLATLEGSGSTRRGVALVQSPTSTSQLRIPDIYSDEAAIKPIITKEIQRSIASSSGQYWQSVEVNQNGTSTPAILVGAPLELPIAGQYQLYIIYSLQTESETLGFVQRVMLIGSVILLILLIVLSWWVTRQVVKPVQNAAAVAERLADGVLTERMDVHGDDEIARLARTFNTMADSLQEQIERLAAMTQVQQRFVSDVAHELRTPVTTIRMASEVIHQTRDQMPPTVSRSADLLMDQLDRFEALLSDLLEMSRFDAGAAVLIAEEEDVVSVVNEVVDFAKPLADQKEVQIIVNHRDKTIEAEIEPRRIERIIRNLIINAIEHAEGRPIAVATAATSRTVCVVVRDNGVGMTTEQTDHVFDRFWRGDPARARTTGGTGLGLAIAVEDARLHGGRLEVWSKPGRGASFRLSFPRHQNLTLGDPPLPLDYEIQNTGAMKRERQ